MLNNNQYSFANYVPASRWLSYWEQINQVLALAPKSLLVVGVGDAVVINYLKKYIPEVKTLDIEASLSPDVVASVDKIPFTDGSFDAVLCAEVLEHLPFGDFEKCLLELKRVTRKFVVLSLPHFGPAIKLSFKFPFVKEKKLAFKLPILKTHILGGEHYWEVGKKNYSKNTIKKIIGKYFEVINDFVPFDNQYHHFYILSKAK